MWKSVPHSPTAPDLIRIWRGPISGEGISRSSIISGAQTVNACMFVLFLIVVLDCQFKLASYFIFYFPVVIFHLSLRPWGNSGNDK
jgi:hypothetical protein